MKFHFYADDTQLYMYLTHKNATWSFERLNRCLDEVKLQLGNKLKHNLDKPSLSFLDQKCTIKKFKSCFQINKLSNPLHHVKMVKNLGVWFDFSVSFPRHVQCL